MGERAMEAWDNVADAWVRHADANDYRNDFLLPRMLAWLDASCAPVTGKRVLDLGCGDGRYARAIAARGAQVTGVDASARLIEVARQRAPGLRFVCADAARLSPFADGAFDAIVAAMSLMDVAAYDGAVAECARVLGSGGQLLMTILHPCFTMRGAAWERRGDELLHYKVDRYFDRTPWSEQMTPSFPAPLVRFHRPLQDVIGGALRARLSLVELVEPEPTPDELARSHRFRKLLRVPYFLFLRFRR